MKNLDTISQEMLKASIDLFLKAEDEEAIFSLLHRITENPIPVGIIQIAKDYDQSPFVMEEMLDAMEWTDHGFVNPTHLAQGLCVVDKKGQLRITPAGRIKLLLDFMKDGFLPVVKENKEAA